MFGRLTRLVPNDTTILAGVGVGIANAVGEHIRETYAEARETYEDEMNIRAIVLNDLESVLREMERSFREAENAAKGTPAAVAFAGENALAYQVCRNTFEAMRVIADKMTGVLPLDIDPRDAHQSIKAGANR